MQELAFDLGSTAWNLCELKGSFTFKALHSILSFLSFQWETQLKQRHGPLFRTLSNTPVSYSTRGNRESHPGSADSMIR